MQRTTPQDDTEIARGLVGLLGDTYVLYNTTQAFHWNVVGPRFAVLHEMFERQYTELAAAIDTIAERIRALGYYAPSTLDELIAASRLQQAGDVHTEEQMLGRLLEGHRQIAHRLRELLNIADEAMDEATSDLLVERLRVHDKTAWMIDSQAGTRPISLREIDEVGSRRSS